jgi:hypothetical protein
VVNNGNIASLLRSGQVNVGLFGLTQKDLNDLKTTGLTVDHQATPDFIHLQLAEDSGPFADERVRQAVADVLPYQKIVRQHLLRPGAACTVLRQPQGARLRAALDRSHSLAFGSAAVAWDLATLESTMP